MTPRIAIVGMACVFPDARSPRELWENVLAQRRAFRRMPSGRLNAEDYLSPDRSAPDKTYTMQAALIEGYEFDRVRFRVSGEMYRSADLAHWLALDVASRALADAGFPDCQGLPRHATAVLVGNSLTGEFSRASGLRLRWPYVRRVVGAALAEEGWEADRRREFLAALESRFKQPFPEVGEESLAGGLSNTIAGRICNYFDLKGGGYTVDGACSSSLLAVANACSALENGDVEAAIVGGVDLSLDPFEIVGFAKNGALAPEEMRVYDARSAGFWPGEGCGFVVLLPLENALARGLRPYAVIRGWGISSDGRGGLTRPEVEGQRLALSRTYARADYPITSVEYFEGHGTGTQIGDAVELRALSAELRAQGIEGVSTVGSVKANIGHTKAAAGIAGLIKATMAVQAQVLPPATGLESPHPELLVNAPALRVLRDAEPWPTGRPLRAGVSGMGFGGINVHVTLEGAAAERRAALAPQVRALGSSAQDAELFPLSASDLPALRREVERLSSMAAGLSRSELADLSATLMAAPASGAARAAIVASTPDNVASRLARLLAWIDEGAQKRIDVREGVFLGQGTDAPRVVYLFPGQGSPARLGGGALRRRFASAGEIYASAGLPAAGEGVETSIAQPAICAASVAGLHVLDGLGIEAAAAVGHSLGELTALCWGGALDREALIRIATIRGRAMSDLSGDGGSMASVDASESDVASLLDGDVVIAGLNAPRKTVVSGKSAAVLAVIGRARERGWSAQQLRVSHAFHSPLMAGAWGPLATGLQEERLQPLRRAVISTVTGRRLEGDEDLPSLLHRQLTSPVRFAEAIGEAARGADLLIEVGPGEVLSGILFGQVTAPCVPIDAGGPSLAGILRAAGAAFALGAPIRFEALLAGRFTRPFDLLRTPTFFTNPCELAPPPAAGDASIAAVAGKSAETPERLSESSASRRDTPREPEMKPDALDALTIVRQLVAERVELPLSAVRDENHLLGDLHMNSIAVGELVAEACKRLGLPAPIAPNEFADSTVAEAARALEEMTRGAEAPQRVDAGGEPPGIEAWTRAFRIELVERAAPPRRANSADRPRGTWRVVALPDSSLAASLHPAIEEGIGGRGVLACLPPDPDERHIDLLLEAARHVLAQGAGDRFVLVQHGGGGAAFARTLHLEARGVRTLIVDVPLGDPRSVAWILEEARAENAFAEVHYDVAGRRLVPVMRLLATHELPAAAALGASDVLLVTGGGKGIAAECAFSLARATGVRLVLLGRSEVAADRELAANLERMSAGGCDVHYFPCDVSDSEAVRAATLRAEREVGAITGVLHAAGTNVPQLLRVADRSEVLRTLAPKLLGIRNLLSALDASRLKLFVTFGSLIARTGLVGEGAYGLANEWVTRLTERLGESFPACRCLSIEWSIWSGSGMGERLGRVEALSRAGIDPITPDRGVAIFEHLLSRRIPSGAVIVAGRSGSFPTLERASADLPLLRFLERPRAHYPGIELIADADLSLDSDPYLGDHVFRGQRLLPAVIGLEAMAQAAMAVSGSQEPPVFEDLEMRRPLAVPAERTVSIRVATLVEAPGRVAVVLRSEETGFQVDHFRASCRFPAAGTTPDAMKAVPGLGSESIPTGAGTSDAAPLVSARDLYGGLLFQGQRFRRLRGYRRLSARGCLAEIMGNGNGNWFLTYLPSRLVLGDPAIRDAALHSIQACIPGASVLPVGAKRIVPASGTFNGPLLVSARERRRDGDLFVYDMEIATLEGDLIERWEGLRLRIVGGTEQRGPWVEGLLGPYIERRVEDLIPGARLAVAVERNGNGDRSARGDRALRHALGDDVATIRRRLDGKPEADAAGGVSIAHAGELTLAVAGPGPLGCDLEPVANRPVSAWSALLGEERILLSEAVSRETGEDASRAATRLWCALECLKKAGLSPQTPLTLASRSDDGWVLLAAGRSVIATFVASVRGENLPIALALLAEGTHASL